jgi:hypothetical protein
LRRVSTSWKRLPRKSEAAFSLLTATCDVLTSRNVRRPVLCWGDCSHLLGRKTLRSTRISACSSGTALALLALPAGIAVPASREVMYAVPMGSLYCPMDNLGWAHPRRTIWWQVGGSAGTTAGEHRHRPAIFLAEVVLLPKTWAAAACWIKQPRPIAFVGIEKSPVPPPVHCRARNFQVGCRGLPLAVPLCRRVSDVPCALGTLETCRHNLEMESSEAELCPPQSRLPT